MSSEGERNFGSDVRGADEALAKLQALDDAMVRQTQQQRLLQGAEVATTTAINEDIGALQRAITETRSLTAATGELTAGLRAETEALLANVTAWSSRTAAMKTSGAAAANISTLSAAEIAALTAEARPTPVARARTIASGEEGALFSGYRSRRTGITPANQVIYDAEAAAAARRRTDPGTPLFDPAGKPTVIYDTTRVHGPEDRSYRTGPGSGGISPQRLLGPGNPAAQADALSAQAAATQRLASADGEARSRAAALASEQLRVNQAYQQSVAVYAESSSALSRNGALTTEFIQAFARGDVTLKEFESQMVSTIGKFGGWAVAGGAVYGAYEALKKLVSGMTETQAGVQQLSRFIPTAGSSQRGETEQTFRNLSLQLNVPISEVVSSMTLMARTFHTVSAAGEATRAVLLASRLDQISPDVSARYFTGIAQSIGVSGPGLVGVIDSLNALQNEFSARVSQTLPGVAIAAPAANAAGLAVASGPLANRNGLPLLESLVGVGVRSGLTGPQVGTALLRAFNGTQEFGVGLPALESLGLRPQRGQFGDLLNQIVKRQTGPADERFSEGNLRTIAQSLGGTLQGPRVLLPLLQNVQLLPALLHTAQNPPQTAQEELGHVLGGIGEEFKHIGIVLGAIGSELESVGITSALQVVLKGLDAFGNALTFVLQPVDAVANTFGNLPGVIKDAVGVGIGVAGFQALRRSDLGFTTQQFIGRLPALGALAPAEQEQALRTLAGQRNTFLLPQLARREESANLNAVNARLTQRTALGARNEAEAVLLANPEDETAQGTAAAAAKNYAAAAGRAADAEAEAAQATQEVLRAVALNAEITDRRVPLNQRVEIAEANGLSLANQTNETRAEIITSLRKQLRDNQSIAGLAAEGGIAVVGARGGGFNGTRGEPLVADAGAGPSRVFIGSTDSGQTTIAPAGEETIATGATGFANSAARSDLANLGGSASLLLASAGGAAKGLLSNPLGLLIGSQIAGSIVPGKAGSAISEAGLLLGGGAFLGKFLAPKIAGLAEYAGLGEAGALGSIGTLGLGAGLIGVGLGTTTRGVGGVLEGVGGGALAGAAVGTIVPVIGTAIGAVAGGVIGGAAHFLGTDLFGFGGPSAQQQDAARQLASSQRLARAAFLRARQLSQGQGIGGVQLQDFSALLQPELHTAFDNGSNQQDAQKAQTQIERAARNATQLLAASGIRTPLGRTAQGLLEQITRGVLTSNTVRQDPYDTGQIIDNAVQGELAGIQARFTYQTTTSPDLGQSALAASASSTRSSYRAAAGATIKNLQAQADYLERLQRALDSSGQDGGSLNSSIAAVKTRLAQAAALGSQINAKDVQQISSEAQQVVGNITTQASDLASLASARAGGNAAQQAAAQIAGSQSALREITAVQNTLRKQGLPANTLYFREQRESLATSITTARTQRTQALGSQLQSRLAIGAAQVPSDDTVQAAQVALSNATTYYKFVAANAHALGPDAVNQAIAAQKQAATALTVALRAQVQAQYQITETQQTGDPLAAAYTALAAATKSIASAKGSGELLAAQEQYAQAVQTVHSATTQQIADIGALQASESNRTLVQDAAKQGSALKQLQNAIKGGYGRSVIRTLQTNYNTTVLQAFNDRISQDLGTLQYQESTLQISAQTALARLEQLAKNRNLSVSQRQQISSQEYAIETSQNNTSLFDLRPGGTNIRTPTIYDIRQAVGRTRHDIGGPYGAEGHVNIGGALVNTTAGQLNTYDTKVEQAIKDLGAKLVGTNHGRGDVTFNFEVKNARDVPKVAETIERVIGSSVKSRLKSAGRR